MTFTFQLPIFSNTLSNKFSISIFISFKYYFFIHFFFHHLFFLYSFPQLYFSIKSIISTTFFAILLQESHQNLMWKVVTSSNLNLLLKLYFTHQYQLITIYYLRFIVKILWQYFLIVFSYFLYYFSFLNFIRFFPHIFFFLVFSSSHTYPTPISIYPSFSFSSSFRTLFFFFFFFFFFISS